MKRKILFIVVLFLMSCSRGCKEASFILSPESRLPKWVSLPPGYTRDAVTVKLIYYTSPFPVDNAVFELIDQNDKTIVTVTGKMCWHPEMEKKRNKYGGFDTDSYPHYVYIRTNGALEVIEHTRGPTFGVSDNPELVRGAIESKECK